MDSSAFVRRSAIGASAEPFELMRFDGELAAGVLIRRYKRFLADVRLGDGSEITMHCPNTGAMTGCCTPGSKVWFSTSTNPKRKYANTLEIIEPLETADAGSDPDLVGIHPGRANGLVEEAINAGVIGELEKPSELRREVAVPDESGRFDFGFVDTSGTTGYVEVKSVTLCLDEGVGAFPDAVSERALRHVQALRRRCAEKERGVLLFCVQHTGIHKVRCADEIYPEYAEAVSAAAGAGVEVLAYACKVSPQEIRITESLPVFL